eukprot:CAMPEP_0183293554 /NCGR_PEP_ID=MMETSP0160_2-20130417/2194_1 /TAXON_ID=2839 ORGANISM="Odontella Sinensis, Strain Grunow 1884" /NCGR_SAMPLE_ID=MMETSP0160_2 /ASSEMBLY_ACC=CAM_ASM_000250 /LENGTH=187 /DNA_ID=CAMNT_0025454687 /DNA_START=1122 /DNA_END=1683 /DNA_ORIENTATION=-
MMVCPAQPTGIGVVRRVSHPPPGSRVFERSRGEDGAPVPRRSVRSIAGILDRIRRFDGPAAYSGAKAEVLKMILLLQLSVHVWLDSDFHRQSAISVALGADELPVAAVERAVTDAVGPPSAVPTAAIAKVRERNDVFGRKTRDAAAKPSRWFGRGDERAATPSTSKAEAAMEYRIGGQGPDRQASQT